MKEKLNKNALFRPKIRKNYSGFALLSLLILCIFSITVAYFFSNDYASKTVVMTGKVDIEAVGKGNSYSSIQDTSSSSNLVIYLDDIYNTDPLNPQSYTVLIPGMPISLDANCKVYRSTTKPLLRAKFEVEIYDDSNTLLTDEETVYTGTTSLYDSFTTMIDGVITHDSDWLLYSDGYYYYIGSHTVNATPGNTELWEVDATSANQVVTFIDRPITFPTEIDESFSTCHVKFIITFEAIQNFIPNEYGEEITSPSRNTIINAKNIFDAED